MRNYYESDCESAIIDETFGDFENVEIPNLLDIAKKISEIEQYYKRKASQPHVGIGDITRIRIDIASCRHKIEMCSILAESIRRVDVEFLQEEDMC